MKYKDFFIFLRKWRDFGKLPPMTGWPKQINLDSKGWEGIKKLYRFTEADGHEYETSFFYVEGETFLSTPQRGTRENVRAQHSLSVKYEADQKRRVYIRNVIIDDKVVKKDRIKPERLPKNTDIGFLFNIHTHPVHLNHDGEKTYSFFSDTDIRSLIGSNAMVTGLVTDEFWLAAKTDSTISQIGEVGVELLYEISHKAFQGEKYLEELIKENMSRWGIVFYRGRFSRSLERVN